MPLDTDWLKTQIADLVLTVASLRAQLVGAAAQLKKYEDAAEIAKQVPAK